MMASRQLLELLESERFRELSRHCKRVRYPAKRFIARPDSKENRIFIVLEGQVRVFLGHESKEFTLTFLNSGDIYSTHTHAFIQAMQDSLILGIDTALFGRALLQYPEVTSSMIGVLGGALRNSIEIIEDLAFRGVQERLARFLLNQARHSGKTNEDGSIRVPMEFSTEDIACLLGTSRQSVSIFLNQLVKQGVLKREGRKALVILDPAALAGE